MHQLSTGVYRHYKGNFYRVLHVAQHTETSEQLVVYQALYGDRSVWVRPVDMFQESVETQTGTQPRFELVEPTEAEADPGKQAERRFTGKDVQAREEAEA